MDSTLDDSWGKVAAPARLWRRSGSGAFLAVGLPQQGPAILIELPANAALAKRSMPQPAGPICASYFSASYFSATSRTAGDRAQPIVAPLSVHEGSECRLGPLDSVRNVG